MTRSWRRSRASDAVARRRQAQRVLTAERLAHLDAAPGANGGACGRGPHGDRRQLCGPSDHSNGTAARDHQRWPDPGVGAGRCDLAIDHPATRSSLVDLGEHRLRDLARPERVYQVTGPDCRSDFPPLTSLDAHRHNLPIQLSSFVGRIDEIATVAGPRPRESSGHDRGRGEAQARPVSRLQGAAELADQSTDGTWLGQSPPTCAIPTSQSQRSRA